MRSDRTTLSTLVRQAEAYQRLVAAALAVGVPTSLDDPRSPRTVAGLRAAVRRAGEETNHG